MGQALLEPQQETVNRSELRQNQKAVLRKAKGRRVVVVQASDEGEEKVLLDKTYFDEMLGRLRAVVETLEITMDERLFGRIMAVADTLEDDLRLGKLHSIDEAFGED